MPETTESTAPPREDVAAFVAINAPLYKLDPEVLMSIWDHDGEFRSSTATSDDLPRIGEPWKLKILAGIKYLGALHERFGDYPQTLAAYQCGAGQVGYAVRTHGDKWKERLPARVKSYLCVVLGKTVY